MRNRVKIGWTTDFDPYEYIRGLENRCKFVAVKLTVLPIRHEYQMYAAYRCEQLLHAHFKDVQQIFKCSGCKHNHYEWFCTKYEKAVEIGKIYSTWVRTTYGERFLGLP